MILYFSGTGNSQFVAAQIAAATKDEMVSLNHLIKENFAGEIVCENQPWIFVCPVYAWRVPRLVEDFIRQTTFRGSKQAYFVLTCGSESAHAIAYVKKLCAAKGWELRGFGEVMMPENYIAMFPTPDQATAQGIIAKAAPVIAQIATDIAQGNSFAAYVAKGMIGQLESGVVNNIFYSLIVHAKGFHVTNECIGCGQCVALCPLNNIALVDRGPVWGNHCTHCMACICRCPTNAIEYKNRTQNKPRYSLEATFSISKSLITPRKS